MVEFWIALWTVVWFGGLALFTLLAIVVSIGAGKDVVSLLMALRRRHMESRAEGRGPAASG